MPQQKPTLKISPKVLMAPALQQAIKLLQLTRLELEQLLRSELETNPLLELEEELEEASELTAASESGETAEASSPSEDGGAAEGANGEAQEEAPRSMEEVELSALFANDLHDVPPRGDVSFEEEELDPLANIPAPSPTFTEELLSQLHLLPVPSELRPLAEFLVGNLDPDGYLRTSLQELAAQLGASPEAMEQALFWVQQLEPAGVGARTLQECLLLQLARKTDEDPQTLALAKRLVAEAFPLLLQQDWDALAARLGAAPEALRAALALLRKLPLHPGAALGPEEASPVEPEVIVRKVNGRWQVELVDDNLPRVHLSPRYLRLLESHRHDRETVEFVRERMRQALWFLRAVDQRHRTVLRVAQAIVRAQEGFLEEGIRALKPMTLKELADELGLSESTVSRVVQGKYMDTPRGVLPFKFFFHSGLSHALQGEVSSVVVKEKIRELILGEDPEKPLADSRIARLLNRQGIRIARRTVAKYREEMGIPSSELRKKGGWMRAVVEAGKIAPR